MQIGAFTPTTLTERGHLLTKNTNRFLLVAFSGYLAFRCTGALPLAAQTLHAPNVARQLAGMKDPDRNRRRRSFESLLRTLPPPRGTYGKLLDGRFSDSLSQLDPETAEQVKKLVLSELQHEEDRESINEASSMSTTTTSVLKPATEDSGSVNDEGEDTYLNELLFFAADQRDLRFLPLLMREIDTGGIVQRGIANIGPSVLDTVLSDDPISTGIRAEDQKVARPFVLRAMLDNGTVTSEKAPNEFSRIEFAALRWSKDKDVNLRLADCYLLAALNTTAARAALKEAANGIRNPSSIEESESAVRQTATRLLGSISAIPRN